ncbi:MAG: ABC-type transport auxiliary lipoprotein family protein [Pacificimonas sp.]
MSRILTLAVGVGLLAACGPLVQVGGGAAAPDSLLTIASTETPPAVLSGDPVLIVLPDVPGKLRTTRVPVTTATNEIEYLGEASWIEQPNILFQRLLADRFEAATGRPALDEKNIDIAPMARLSGKLMEFGLDVRNGRQVLVRFDADLTRPDSGLVGSRRFEATAPVSISSGPAVARALQIAANDVAGRAVAWAAASAP